jgi:signal peptidase I
VPQLRKFLKSDYFIVLVTLVLVIAIVIASFLALGLVLGTSVPIRVVESGSMCTNTDGCDGWSHPFEPTLHVGDVIIIQQVDPKDLNANYPNSDIIVYQNPAVMGNLKATPIVHRIVAEYTINGTLYFQTKGDGNCIPWPNSVDSSQYDSNTLWTTGQGVSQDQVLGRVVMRIPYLGWITLFMNANSWVLPTVVGVIVLIIILQFILPITKAKKKKGLEQQQKHEGIQV